MKLDATNVRYITPDQFRVLQAVEIGSRNHEIVPLSLICTISKQRSGNALKILHDLSDYRLVTKQSSGNQKYEGFILGYGGLDYLALKKFSIAGSVTSLGNQIGVGKESDVYMAYNDEDEVFAVKLHRLGRTSFRTVRANRDYLQRGKCSDSWLHLSCLSASKEYSYMNALYSSGMIPVPRPIDYNRHCVVMEWIDGVPLSGLRELPDGMEVESLYCKLMMLIQKLAECGLIHGDFNEFNLMMRCQEPYELVLIDFPQMISTNHSNAEEYYERDVECVRRWFLRKFGYEHHDAQSHGDVPRLENIQRNDLHLDTVVEASGFDPKLRRQVIIRNREQSAAATEEESQECLSNTD